MTIPLLRQVYGAARDPAKAAAMAGYMKGRFDFLGIPTPQRRALSREVLAAGKPGVAELPGIALACWELPEREYQYFATDLLVRYAARLPADFVATAEQLITTKSWWDTVDLLATRVVGSLVTRHPELRRTMDDWSRHENLWLVRTAILYQLHAGARTDTVRLFGYCAAQAGHRDFFVRKAIGWALRQYARTDPDGVRRFVSVHREELSPLSVREAMKHL
ncbi:MAG: DNA alkylation repair protein [Micromonosporaceae bacterium]